MTGPRALVREFDVIVVGGGMAGLCAAIASARRGMRTALVHDRPVLGGNASSEVRMWICGAHGPHNKETGILEEVQLENLRYNPGLHYSIWDATLWAKAHFQPGLTLFLNATCHAAEMAGDRIESIGVWQLTTQRKLTLHARTFIDCSGDSILAALTPAQFRVGREAREEFGEDIEPERADRKTMGSSLLIQLRRTAEPQPFTPPPWACRFESPEDLPQRVRGVTADNFWWLEVGGLQDTIGDAEEIRDTLMQIGYGVWDYLKNRAPEREKAENWALEWMGSLPGKRESRRYRGLYTLTQNDIRDGGQFDDIIAYGGWSMDDHHPAGIFYPGAPTIFHAAPSPYGIPYRSLVSADVPNLLFAGRNISVTHAALSSTRVMATCALLGQAAGTAAAVAAHLGAAPADLTEGEALRLLQNALMEDDCWLPGHLRRTSEMARAATLSTTGAYADRLLDGVDRDRPDSLHAWEGACRDSITFRWPVPVRPASLRIVFDSNLCHEKRMPCSYPHRSDRSAVPGSMVRSFRVEAEDSTGRWRTLFREPDQFARLARVPIQAEVTALRFVAESTWGDETVRIFALEPLHTAEPVLPRLPQGPTFRQLQSAIDAADLAPPESGLEGDRRRGGA